MPARTVVVALASLLAFATAACTSTGADEPSPRPTSPTDGGSEPASPAPTARTDAIPQVLDFEAPLLGGGTLRGEDLAGKDVAFWFWAPW